MAAKLVARGVDYVLALQQNQKELHRQVATHFAPCCPSRLPTNSATLLMDATSLPKTPELCRP